ncbi:hypothetical protein [Arthrobacter sp. 260]|uniref:hypothetical protein n=1 Tax=Arthrobacter sp. 260 TaxID=2735314 RepID=UPI001492200D|nr:hypothetical protein [Arthrobacter sp. 260]NOJ60102.1 hypothetical protein [Arthrobacter sp. 260]
MTHDALDDDRPLDLHTALRLVKSAEDTARRELRGNEALQYLVWGLAWLLGFGTLHGSRFGWLPIDHEPALAVFGVAILLAIVVTIVVAGRYSRGIRGHSSFTGTMYGVAWALGFLVMGTLSGVIVGVVDDFWVRGMLMNGIAILIVGLLYITGGTTFNDKTQSVMGVWFLVVDMAALLSGSQHYLTVFFIFGSGGFLVAAVLETVRRRKQAQSNA